MIENRLQVNASVAEIRKVCEFVVQAAKDAGLDDDAIYHCEIAVEEACTNIIEHGFGGTHPNAHIEIATEREGAFFVMTLSDNSPAFDPTQQQDPDLSSDFVKMEPGGLGIYFYKKLMDKVAYRYEDGHNHLTLYKRLA